MRDLVLTAETLSSPSVSTAEAESSTLIGSFWLAAGPAGFAAFLTRGAVEASLAARAMGGGAGGRGWDAAGAVEVDSLPSPQLVAAWDGCVARFFGSLPWDSVSQRRFDENSAGLGMEVWEDIAEAM